MSRKAVGSNVDTRASGSERKEAQRIANRILAQIRRLAEISATETGVTRLAYSKEDATARSWLLEEFSRRGLTAEVDEFGNCFGWPPSATGIAGTPGRLPVLLGSHLDSVPSGGAFDGVLGVVAALEIADHLLRTSSPTQAAVINFACEESSRFGVGTVGSRLMFGELDDSSLDSLKDTKGDTLRTVLKEAGIVATRPGRIRLDARRARAYIELHIDQGETLTVHEGQPLGIVNVIAGIGRLRVRWVGAPAHSGAHSAAKRRDALLAAARLVVEAHAIGHRVARDGAHLVVTVGRLTVEPNSPNTVPSAVEMTIDLRSDDTALLKSTGAEIQSHIERISADSGVRAQSEWIADYPAVQMNEEVMGALTEAGKALAVPTFELVSWAGHDAKVVSKALPTGMLLVANPACVSHSPAESVNEERLVDAVGGLLRAIVAIGDKTLTAVQESTS